VVNFIVLAVPKIEPYKERVKRCVSKKEEPGNHPFCHGPLGRPFEYCEASMTNHMPSDMIVSASPKIQPPAEMRV
jgi:hypothetical protein